MKRIYSIFELLKVIQLRPGMFLIKKKSIFNLLDFKYGYQMGLGKCGYEEKLLYELFHEFQDYIVEETIGMKNRKDDCWKYWECLLKVCNGDEEKAYDLFFVLLDEFIKKENIKINIQ